MKFCLAVRTPSPTPRILTRLHSIDLVTVGVRTKVNNRQKGDRGEREKGREQDRERKGGRDGGREGEG